MNESVVLARIRSILQQEIAAVEGIPVDGSIEQAIELIYRQVHEKRGKMILSGIGKAGQIGMTIATTLSSTGTPAVFLHPSEAQHGDLGIMQPHDVLMLISNSGKTREVLELQHLARILQPDTHILCLTGNQDSELAKKSDVALYTGAPQEVCPLGLTPTTSTTAMAVIGDILVVLMMEKIGFSKQEYAKRHHSGYVGQKARENA